MVAIRTRRQALEAIKGLQEDINSAENDIEEAKSSIRYSESQIAILRQKMETLPDADNCQLGRLFEITNLRGTGHERAVVELAYKGEDLDDQDLQRVKILSIQFLGELIEV